MLFFLFHFSIFFIFKPVIVNIVFDFGFLDHLFLFLFLFAFFMEFGVLRLNNGKCQIHEKEGPNEHQRYEEYEGQVGE